MPSLDLLDRIGRTPLVALRSVARGLRLPVLVKCEHLNPGGSVKDRLALAIARDAAGAGTGGTISGVGRVLRREVPGVRIVLADPAGSGLAGWFRTGVPGPAGSYAVEGIGQDTPPENLHRDVLDGVETITDDESFAAARRLIRDEGLLVGGSAGTNLAAALRVAAREDLTGPVVTVLPDSWDRYFSRPWLAAAR
jgi:cysteine synthase